MYLLEKILNGASPCVNCTAISDKDCDGSIEEQNYCKKYHIGILNFDAITFEQFKEWLYNIVPDLKNQ